ncbi:MAG: WD40/YVTN/BNR-like repeat-containing protein [Thermoanaerobaculia bacterium]
MTTRRKIAIALAVVLTPFLRTAPAREGGTPAVSSPEHPRQGSRRSKWVYTGGPVGGLGYDVRIQPDNPDVMYVTDAFAGAFKSVNGGVKWSPINKGIDTRGGPSGDAIPVFSLTIDPNDHRRLWAGTQYSSGVFRSDNAGKKWKRMDRGIKESFLSVRGFSVEPGNSKVVYFAAEVSSSEWNNGQPLPGRIGLDITKGVVYKTVNGGRRWKRIWRGDNLARYIWIHPANHDLLYVSTGIFDREAANRDAAAGHPGGVGILRSRDGGKSWETLDEANGLGDDELHVGSLYMHPENPDLLLAASGNDPYTVGGLYRTVDGGDTWEEVLDVNSLSAVEICSSDPNVAYAGSIDGFYRSMDAGASWQQLGGFLWGPDDTAAGFPIDIACDPVFPDRLFVNNYGGGNFLSVDGGQSWTVASRGYTGALMAQIAVAQGDATRVYASARSGLFGTENSGRNWHGLGYGVAHDLEGLAIAVEPTDPLHVLATLGDAGPDPLESFDGGRSWQRLNTGMWAGGPTSDMVTSIVFSPSRSRTIFATVGEASCWTKGVCRKSSGRGVIVSRNGGKTWKTTGLKKGEVVALAIAPQTPSLIYAAVFKKGIYRSTNDGRRWRRVSAAPLLPPAGPGQESLTLRSLVVDRLDSNKLFAGFDTGGIATSVDGGETWTAASAGLPAEATVNHFATHPKEADVVYAASQNSGVFVTRNGGQTWNAVNGGLKMRAARHLAMASDGSRLYVATEGGGVFRLKRP